MQALMRVVISTLVLAVLGCANDMREDGPLALDAGVLDGRADAGGDAIELELWPLVLSLDVPGDSNCSVLSGLTIEVFSTTGCVRALFYIPGGAPPAHQYDANCAAPSAMNCIEQNQLAVAFLPPGAYRVRIRGLEGSEWVWGSETWIPVWAEQPFVAVVPLERD